MRKLVLVTPLKNEISNIDVLFESLAGQSCRIDHWIIVENGSTDGSKEKLDQIKAAGSIAAITVINFSLPSDRYELGQKYATVVSKGFGYIKENGIEYDYLGILDADCMPPTQYYESLIVGMENDKKLGITSGHAYYQDGSYDGKDKRWPRGNCRIWRKACFDECGYHIGPSADALSVCVAQLKEWKCEALPYVSYVCREVGKKVDYSYYGYSAYFRGIPLLYAILKSMNYIRIGQYANAYGYFVGYMRSFFARKEKFNNIDVVNYNRKILSRKVSDYLKANL